MAMNLFPSIQNVTGPYTLAAFAISAIGFYVASRIPPNEKASRLLLFGIAMSILIITVVAIVFTNRPAPYVIHAVAVYADGQELAKQQKVTFWMDPSIPAPPPNKSGADFTVEGSQVPKDAKITIYASLPSALLTGSKELTLAGDRRPSIRITMASQVKLPINGYVQSGNQRIRHAKVFVLGYEKEATSTNSQGTFKLNPHKETGETIELRIERAGYQTLNSSVVLSNELVPIEIVPANVKSLVTPP